MVSRPRRTLRQPQRFDDEFAAPELVPSLTRPKRPKKDNNLYEIEVTEVDWEKKLVRIHYKGYESRFDEWRPYDRDGEYFPFIRQEKPHVLTATSFDDKFNHFADLIYRSIKRALYSGRKDDPVVRVEVDVMEDVFNLMLGNVVDGVIKRGRLVYHIPSNRALDSILGQKWDERIINVRGDCCFVARSTIKFWLGKKSPIVEYKLIGGKYVKTEIEDCCLVVFIFVRGTGNRIQYEQRE